MLKLFELVLCVFLLLVSVVIEEQRFKRLVLNCHRVSFDRLSNYHSRSDFHILLRNICFLIGVRELVTQQGFFVILIGGLSLFSDLESWTADTGLFSFELITLLLAFDQTLYPCLWRLQQQGCDVLLEALEAGPVFLRNQSANVS